MFKENNENPLIELYDLNQIRKIDQREKYIIPVFRKGIKVNFVRKNDLIPFINGEETLNEIVKA